MDELFIAAVVLVAAIPVLCIVAIVMASNARAQVRRLEARMARLEAGVPRASAGETAMPDTSQAANTAPEADTHVQAAPPPDEALEIVPESEPEPTPEPPASPLPARGFDERIGARWAVWVGGLALALGAVFLVRYSIEQGFFGPGMRIASGIALSLVLLGLGEKMRRAGRSQAIAGLPGEHIPAILTGAGSIAAFATIYAAHALYGMLSAGPAFGLLGAVGLATLVAAALHQPWVAGLGLVGAYATPLLVNSPAPNYWALCAYLAVVTAAALKLAEWRAIVWIAAAAVVASVVWGMVIALAALPLRGGVELAAYIAALAVIFAHVFALRPAFRDALGGQALLGAALVLGALGAAYWLNASFTGLPFVVVVALIAGQLGLALHSPRNALLSVAAAALAVAGYALGASDFITAPQDWATTANAPAGYGTIGLLLGGLLGAGGLVLAVLTPARAVSAAVGVATPLILFLLAYRGLTYTDPANAMPAAIFGVIALALGAGFAALASMLARLEDKHPTDPGYPQALGIYAAGAAAALALGLAMLLEKGWLVVGLALAALAMTWISTRRAVPYLREVAAAMGVLVAVQLLRNPVIAQGDVGTTPLFNWLIWAYGVPAAAFAGAAVLLRWQRDGLAVRVFEALAILFAAAFAFLEMRHFIHDGNLLAKDFTLAEQGLATILALAFALGLQRIQARAQSPVLRFASFAAGLLSFAAIAVMHFVVLNPLFTGRSIGAGVFFNDLLLAYLLPGAMAGLVYWRSAGRPQWYLRIAGGLALALIFAYLSLQVRALFHGERLVGYTSPAEWYTYSAVWLGYGVALLAGGLIIDNKALRFASAIVVVFTVAKVFLFDMAALEGVLRALSFLGLGAVLIAIGYAYQRLLFSQANSMEGE